MGRLASNSSARIAAWIDAETVLTVSNQSGYVTMPRRSIGEHGQCSPAVSRLQSKKQRAGFLDVLFGTTLGGRLEGNRSRMIRPTDKFQSFSQAPHGCVVDLCLFHSGESPKHQPVSSRRSVSGVVAPAKHLNSADAVCLAITGAAGTLAHPGRATTVNCWYQSPLLTSSSFPINLLATARGRIRSRMPIVLPLSTIWRSHLGNTTYYQTGYCHRNRWPWVGCQISICRCPRSPRPDINFPRL